MPVYFPPGGSGALSGVTITGTGAAGKVPVATSSSAGAWAYPPGYEFDYAQVTSGNINVTGANSAGATTLVTAAAVVYDGATRICAEFYCSDGNCDTGGQVVVELWDGASALAIIASFQAAATTMLSPVLARIFLTPSAASHTYSVRAWKTAGTCGFQSGTGTAGGFAPLYVRQTKA